MLIFHAYIFGQKCLAPLLPPEIDWAPTLFNRIQRRHWAPALQTWNSWHIFMWQSVGYFMRISLETETTGKESLRSSVISVGVAPVGVASMGVTDCRLKKFTTRLKTDEQLSYLLQETKQTNNDNIRTKADQLENLINSLFTEFSSLSPSTTTVR